MSIAVIILCVRERRRERIRRAEDRAEREARHARLEEAASAIASQADVGRTVADKIRTSKVQVPDELRNSLDQVIIELDGVAHDLRSCAHNPVHRHRGLILHR